ATTASASRRASCGGAFTMWNASRCADFGPIPGSRDSSSIRSWIGPSNTLSASQPARTSLSALPDDLDLAAELCPEPGDGLLLRRRHVVGVDVDDGCAGNLVARDAPDGGRHTE